MNKQKIDFRLEKTEDRGEVSVYLYGDIADERPVNFWTGEEEKGDYITPKEVRTLFDGIKSDKVNLHLNSYGGSVFASVSIFNFLSSIGKDITVFVDGIVASGASIIAMAGNRVVMPKNTQMMIHRASSFAHGNCEDLRELADTLEKLDNSTVFETYKRRFKGSDEELRNLISNETYLSADECFEMGLCDELIELSSRDKGKNTQNKKPSDEEIEAAKKMAFNFLRLKFD